MITINTMSALRGTTVSTPRPHAFPSAATSVAVMPFGVQLDTTGVWGDVRVDGRIASQGQPAWSPPI